ncbi:MAG TPA: alpha/beta hydrolase [Smithellaceae bacterium]|nr:alpha/beta hydrolase [Smithellaceae bacterium]
MSVPVMKGITAKTIKTKRITSRVLFCGPEDGIPVLFLHGNLSSATWWEDNMLLMPEGYLAIAPDQRGFGDSDPEQHIDATRGLADLADDAVALLDELGIEKAHVVGNSLGGNVVYWLMADYSARLKSVFFAGAGSPYGFRGTKDETGTPCYDDFAGSSGGLVNPALIKAIREKDMNLDNKLGLRAAMYALVFSSNLISLEREKALMEASFSIHLGEKDFPGDSVQSPNWPYVSAGNWGSVNALSPKYHVDVKKIYNAKNKVEVIWARGEHDIAVADSAGSDPGVLGKMGLIPNYPSDVVYPPQPMNKQIRRFLNDYAKAGGSYQEVIIRDLGHAFFLERPRQFNTLLNDFILRIDKKIEVLGTGGK